MEAWSSDLECCHFKICVWYTRENAFQLLRKRTKCYQGQCLFLSLTVFPVFQPALDTYFIFSQELLGGNVSLNRTETTMSPTCL